MPLNPTIAAQQPGFSPGRTAPECLPIGGTNFPIDETVNIGPYEMPGQWILTDGTFKVGWQIQKGTGLSGATVTPTGVEPIIAKFKGKLWRNDQMVQYNIVRKVLLIRPITIKTAPNQPTGAALAYGVVHSELNSLGVSTVVVDELTPLVNDGTGLWTATLTLIQYLPGKVAASRPTIITPGVAASGQPALTPNQLQLQAAEEARNEAAQAALLGTGTGP